MDIEHPEIGRYQRLGYLPEDERYAEESRYSDDLFEQMLEDRLDREDDEDA